MESIRQQRKNSITQKNEAHTAHWYSNESSGIQASRRTNAAHASNTERRLHPRPPRPLPARSERSELSSLLSSPQSFAFMFTDEAPDEVSIYGCGRTNLPMKGTSCYGKCAEQKFPCEPVEILHGKRTCFCVIFRWCQMQDSSILNLLCVRVACF